MTLCQARGWHECSRLQGSLALSCPFALLALSLPCSLQSQVGQTRLLFTTHLRVLLLQVLAGMELTGPSMNPAVTFGWVLHHRQQALWEHVLVFWLAPLAGGQTPFISFLAACTYSHVHAYAHLLQSDAREVETEQGRGRGGFKPKP